jgi:5-methylthioribose kinase
MNPQAIVNKLNECVQALGRGNIQLKTLSLEKAKTEKAYRVKQAQEILKLRTEKYPVTIIMELVKGNEEVAELRLQRDIAESAYYTCISAIDNLRLEVEILRSQLTWMRVELKNS